jgi:hypothetical protein
MSIESLTYAELGDRLGASPEAARSLARRLRLPRRPGNDDKVRVTVDLGEIQYKPLPARRPARDHRAETDALNARIEQLRAELAKVEKRRIEVSAAGHRADFERERERCNTLMVEALALAKHAMSAREKAARLEGELAAHRVGGWWRRLVAPQTAVSEPSRAASAAEAAARRKNRGHDPVLVGVPVRA